MATVALFLLLSVPALAQELPDPGRRLTREELQGGSPPKPQKPRSGPRDPQACERARTYYTITCGAQGSRRDYSKSCSEAYELYRQSCS